MQREYNQIPQVIITMPLLEGTDGSDKMSKSYGNDISFTDSPEDMYGKSMSIPDTFIKKYFALAADANKDTLEKIEKQLDDSNTNPRDVKRALGREIVSLYYDEDTALSAEQHFERVIVNKSNPDEMEELNLKSDKSIVDIISSAGLTKSKGEARRMINQGAVRLDGEKVTDINLIIRKDSETVIKVGKRRFIKIK